MKKILTISFAALLVSAAAFSDASVSSKSKKHYAKAGPKPAVVEASSKPKAADSERANSGFYVGAGLGWFDAANEFKAHEPEGGTVFSYVKKKPKGDPAVVPSVLVGYRFNEYFSADVNGQYRKFKYKANRDIPGHTAFKVLPSRQYLSQEVKSSSLFLNANASLPTGTRFVPYVTAGIGYAHNNSGALSAVNIDSGGNEDVGVGFKAHGKKTNNFAWNVGAGTRIEISKDFDLDLSYRYVNLGKIKVNTTGLAGDPSDKVMGVSQRLSAHQATLSLIYNF